MPFKDIFVRFILPILAFALAMLVNWRLNFHSDGIFYSLFFMAILITAYFSGSKAAIILGALSVFKMAYYDLEPSGEFKPLSLDEIIRMGLFSLGAAFIITFIHRLKMTLKRNNYLLHMAERANRSKEELLAVVSHDLRSPLGAILINAQLLKRSLGDGADPKLITKCDSIARSCESMNILIDDLLSSAKLDAGSIHLNKTAFSIEELLLKVQDLMAPVAQKRSIEFEVINKAPISVKADFEKILRVLSNLIGNGIKFTPDGGRVELTVNCSRNLVCFAVKDSGPGIAEEHIPHLFDRFWQSGLEASKGAGLGLTISKGIVESHEGKIWVESQLGEGSCFLFNIPR